MADYYDVLSVSRDADEKTIRQSYRKLARQFHPDLNPGNDEAAGKFKEINEAYEVLSNADIREKYNKYGDQWKYADQYEDRAAAGSPLGGHSSNYGGSKGFNFDLFGDVGDLFGGYGSGGRYSTGPSRLTTQVEISLEEAYHGTLRTIAVSEPTGTRRFEVKIPPGVDTGSTVTVRPSKDRELQVETTVLPHTRFRRRGTDLYTDVSVSMFDALLGGETEVDTIAGKVSLKVPEQSQNGQRIRLSGRGMPVLKTPDKRGDLFVTLRPQLPKSLSDEQRELVEKLKAAS